MREREVEWSELMQTANAGDSAAYHRLLTGITPVLRATTESALAQARYEAERCERVVQEILLAVHLKRHTWDASAPFCPWLLAITRKKLSDAMRRSGGPAYVEIDGFRRPSIDELQSESRTVSEAAEQIQHLPVATELSMPERAMLDALHSGLSKLASKMR